MAEHEFNFTAGLFVRRRFREILELEKFGGRNIRWIETKGLVESIFHVRGPMADALVTESRIKNYAECLKVNG